jgi:hypothetical protein
VATNPITIVGDAYSITAQGHLLGDEFLARLLANQLVVKLFASPITMAAISRSEDRRLRSS